MSDAIILPPLDPFGSYRGPAIPGGASFI